MNEANKQKSDSLFDEWALWEVKSRKVVNYATVFGM